jgi:hypothetical protein
LNFGVLFSPDLFSSPCFFPRSESKYTYLSYTLSIPFLTFFHSSLSFFTFAQFPRPHYPFSLLFLHPPWLDCLSGCLARDSPAALLQ